MQARFRIYRTYTVSPTSGTCQIRQMHHQTRPLEAKLWQLLVQHFSLVSVAVRSALAQMDDVDWWISRLAEKYFAPGTRKHP
jgi:hypothetical protein